MPLNFYVPEGSMIDWHLDQDPCSIVVTRPNGSRFTIILPKKPVSSRVIITPKNTPAKTAPAPPTSSSPGKTKAGIPLIPTDPTGADQIEVIPDPKSPLD